MVGLHLLILFFSFRNDRLILPRSLFSESHPIASPSIVSSRASIRIFDFLIESGATDKFVGSDARSRCQETGTSRRINQRAEKMVDHDIRTRGSGVPRMERIGPIDRICPDGHRQPRSGQFVQHRRQPGDGCVRQGKVH